jgi:hypothetical protein
MWEEWVGEYKIKKKVRKNRKKERKRTKTGIYTEKDEKRG